VDRRVAAELDALLEDETSELHVEDALLVIVSHVSPIKAAVAWTLGAPGAVAWRLRLDNGSLTTIGARQARPYLWRYNLVPPLV
jgi:broad specificity phosphatase PhoE